MCQPDAFTTPRGHPWTMSAASVRAAGASSCTSSAELRMVASGLRMPCATTLAISPTTAKGPAAPPKATADDGPADPPAAPVGFFGRIMAFFKGLFGG